MKISRSELRERVRKILVGTLLDEGEKVSVNLLDTVIKYYFLKSEMVTDDEKKFLEESYVDLIGRKERGKIKEEIDIERIKRSAFSWNVYKFLPQKGKLELVISRQDKNNEWKFFSKIK